MLLLHCLRPVREHILLPTSGIHSLPFTLSQKRAVTSQNTSNSFSLCYHKDGEPWLLRNVSDTCPCAFRHVPPGPQRSHIKASLSLTTLPSSSWWAFLCGNVPEREDGEGIRTLRKCLHNPSPAAIF